MNNQHLVKEQFEKQQITDIERTKINKELQLVEKRKEKAQLQQELDDILDFEKNERARMDTLTELYVLNNKKNKEKATLEINEQDELKK